NLRGGWLPPPVHREGGRGPINNRLQLTKLPHKVSDARYGLSHCAWLAAFAVQAALAATPAITELRPRGAEIGRPFTLTAVGRNLAEGARVTTTLPASFTLVTNLSTPAQTRSEEYTSE